MSLDSPQVFSTKLLKKEKVTNMVWTFYFKKPNGFAFLGGQYVNITLPMLNGREDTYSFTISSAPFEETICITTNKSETPFKNALFCLSNTQEIKIRGPIGGFTFDDTKINQLVFLSGGIGITPFRSIIVDFVKKKRNISLLLLASFSRNEDILFYEELKKIENNIIQIVYTLTAEEKAGFEVGRISEEKVKKYVSHMKSKEFGIAGSGEMVDEMVLMLKKMGVENNNIKTDIFTGL